MFDNNFMKNEEKIYDERQLDELTDRDEMSTEEEGFMLGYLGE